MMLWQRRYTYISLAILVTTGVALFFYSNLAAGATYTWDAGGSTNNWSECANWTSDTCPGASDIAKFDSSTTTDSIVDSSFAGSIAGVDIDAGYTGTITQERNLTIGSSNYDQADGTWRQGTTTFDIGNGSFTLSGGIFETGVGTSTVENNFTISGGTYTASSSSAVTFDDNGDFGDDTILSCSGVLPGKINIAKSFANNADFTLASGCEATAAGPMATDGVITINGTLNLGASFDVNNGTFTNNGTTTVPSGFTGSFERDFTQSGVMDLSQATLLTFDGDNADSSDTTTLSCSGDLGVPIDIAKNDTDHTFTLATGCNATTSGAVSVTINVITVNGTLHFSSTVNLTHGNFTNNGTTSMSGATFTVDENFTQNGVFDLTGITIDFDGDSGDSSDDSTLTCNGVLGGTIDVTKVESGQTFTLMSGCTASATAITSSGPLTINGTLETNGNTLTGSSLTIGSTGTLRIHGGETLTSPTLNSGATVDYYGSGSYSSLIAGTSYSNLRFTGGGTYTISSNITVTGDLTLDNSSTYNASGVVDIAGDLHLDNSSTFSASEDVAIAGDLLSSGNATFNQTSGTLTLDGTSQTITGTSTFNNLTKTVTNTATLFFGANQEQTVGGRLTLQGDSDSTLHVKSTATGTQWKMDMQSFRTLEYLTISDGNNTNSETAYCETGCVDGGNNTNILFTSDPDGGKLYWDGGGSTNNWSECANWKFNACPTPTEVAAFDNRSVKNATIDASFSGEVLGLSIESGYTGTITSNRSLAIGSDGFTLADGTFTSPASTLTVNGNFTHSSGTFSHNNGTVKIAGIGTLTATTSTTFSNITAGDAGSASSTLLAYWKFDETSAGTFADETGNGYTGTGAGSSGDNNTPQPDTNVASGIAFPDPRSLDFDGTDDYVDVPSGLDSFEDDYQDFTISAWVYVPSGGGGKIVSEEQASDQKEWFATVSTTTVSFTYIQNGGSYVTRTTTGTPMSADAWNHVAWVVERGTTNTVKIYVNGSEEALDNNSVDSAWDHSSAPFRIGQRRGPAYYTGKIDDLRLYSTNLSASDVATLADGNEYANASAGTVALSGTTLDVNSNLSITLNSTLDTSLSGCSGSSCNIEVAGDWTNSGTFVPRSGTVTFDGSGQTITGNTTFNKFVKSVSASDTITFGAGDTFTVKDTFTFKGVSGNLLTATSTGGAQWKLNANTYNSTVEYVNVNNSNSVSPIDPMYCYPGCIDGGTNTNWLFEERPEARQRWRLEGGTRLQGDIRFGSN